MTLPGHRPRPRLGQHFLRDPAIVARILEAINPRPNDFIVEIGPGRGALSIPLSNHPIRLAGVELDRALVAWLRWRLPDMRIYEGDILDFDFAQLDCKTLRVIGNLPYHISTEALFRLVHFRDRIQDILVMLQKEVARRIAAPPGASARGRLSVSCQTWYEVQTLFDVPPAAFRPPPGVDSTLLLLRPTTRWSKKIDDAARYAELLRAAFSQRRKILRNALRALCPARALEDVGIPPTARAETLDIDDFVRLSNHLSKSLARAPAGLKR